MDVFKIDATAQNLLARARNVTGITDLIDTSIEERLERLLQSLNTEAQLSAAGAVAMEERLLRLLRNRLRMLRDLREHPEIREQKIVRPVFMTGAPRTGSTKLHKMLAASGDFRFVQGWQGFNLSLRTGDRAESPVERMRESEDYARWLDEHAPNAKVVHEYSSLEPDEDSLILEHCLHAPYLVAFAFVPSYAQWYMAQDARQNIEFIRQGLQYLQWQFYVGSPSPWILKSPAYLGQETLLLEYFPDAFFVTTNRNPVDTMSSAASLCSSYQKAYSDVDRDAFLGPMMLAGFGMAMQQHLAARDQRPDLKFLDIGYKELTQQAQQAVEKIYSYLDLPLSDLARSLMLKWEQDNQQHKQGIHRHSLERYSLTREMVQSSFGAYIERFGDRF